MSLSLNAYINHKWLASLDIVIDKDIKAKLYRVFNQPTFIFIHKKAYNKIPQEYIKDITVLSSNNKEQTPDDLLNTDIVFGIFTDENYIDEVVDTIQLYMGDYLQYMVVDY